MERLTRNFFRIKTPACLPLNRRLGWLLYSLLAFGMFAGQTEARDEVASNKKLSTAGLKVVWFTNAGVGAGRAITDWTMNVDENKSTTFFSVSAGNLQERISQNSLNAFGEPFGLDGAVAYMEVRKEVIEAELKNENVTDIEVKIDQYSLPKSTIYILSRDGLLTAIDADSGHQDWTTSIGSHRLPSIGVGAGNDYVAAVNGSTVYCFEAATGKRLWSHLCQFAVAAAPSVSADKIYVPLLNGRMEVFEIERRGYGSYSLVSSGIATARPLVTESTVSWPTNEGTLNVAASMGLRQRSIRFRLLANGAIENSPTAKDGLIFTTSLDGFVYALDERHGTSMWEVSLGEQITQAPAVIGDSLYAITDDHRMYRLDARTGEQRWKEPLSGVGRYVGASRERIYATDGFGGLLVIDPDSAAILSRVEIGEVQYILPNRASDRLYVATGTGIIQCIHEIENAIPYFHSDEISSVATKKKSATPMPDDSEDGDVVAEDDPFRKLNDSRAADAATDSDVEDDPFAPKGGN